MTAVLDLATAIVQVVPPQAENFPIQLQAGLWGIWTEGNALILTEGTSKPGPKNKNPGFLISGGEALKVQTRTGTFRCHNLNGTPQRIYFAKLVIV